MPLAVEFNHALARQVARVALLAAALVVVAVFFMVAKP